MQHRIMRVAVVAGIAGLGVLPGAALAAPVDIPPVPAPPVSAPQLPSQLDPATAVVAPVLSQECVVYGGMSAILGLGLGAASNLVTQVSLKNADSYLALTGLPCGLALPAIVYDCSADKGLKSAVGSIPVPLPLPIPTGIGAALGEMLYAVGAATGQPSAVNGVITALGCTQAGLGSASGPASVPEKAAPAASRLPAGSGNSPSSGDAPVVGATQPITPGDAIASGTPSASGAPSTTATGQAAAPAPKSALALVQPVAATRSDEKTQPLLVALLVLAIVAALALWGYAGSIAGRDR
ncbi:MAG: hypothetical protein ACYDH6_18050 [Acidimicrobiales bacterium]